MQQKFFYKIFFFVFYFFAINLYSQDLKNDSLQTKKTLQLFLNEDSLVTSITANQDTIFYKQKSVLGATLSSMILPGTGQVYNGAYWKAPVIWGFAAYFGNIVIQQNQLYKQHRDIYSASILKFPPYGDADEKRYRDFYHNQRDQFGWYLFVTYFINVLDAYVDSNLSSFEVNPI